VGIIDVMLGFPQFASIVQGSFENLGKVRTSGVKVLMHLSVIFFSENDYEVPIVLKM
jgi:hypothetical protein